MAMRKPSEYIAKAISGVRSRLMPDCTAKLTHGADEAAVTRIGTTSRGEDEVNDGGPVEAVRVLALARDFHGIARDEAVMLDDEMHIVTGVRIDPSGTSMTVGMSGALTRYAAMVVGVRGSRHLSVPVQVLARDNGPSTDYADGYAPVTVRAWSVVIPRDAWASTSDPQVGDELRLDGRRLRVSRVDPREGYFMISARTRD